MTVPANIPTPLMGSGIEFNLIVNSDAYNLRSAAIAAGWDGITPATFVVTNNAVHRATAVTGYAFDTDVTYPTGSHIKIVVNSPLVGKGGAAARGPGGAGGPAMRLRSSCPWELVINSQVVGGGGAGGWGGGKHDSSSDAWHAGQPGGLPGSAIVAETSGKIDNSGGTIASGGIGGTGGSDSSLFGDSSGGGGGGGAGEGSGGIGNVWTVSALNGASGQLMTPGIGGAGAGASGSAGASGGALGGGAAIVGNSNIAWVATGTRIGSIT